MSQTSAPISIAERYGAPRRSPSARGQRWLIISALVAALAAAVYFTVGNAVGQITYKDVGYTIISDTRASVDYQVSKDFDATVECMIHAMDDSYAIVGAQVVTINPHEGSEADSRSQTFRTELRTEHRAVTGVVDSCWEHEV